MPNFSEPRLWTHRIIIFGPDERISMRMFSSPQVRDAAARDLRLDKGQVAIAVSVDFLIAGGDEPKLRK
ncbi:hypothetical protein LCGC14_1499650 [marine sediment metagenome]|uniref:Uncharacterized protein n=1 Tax=marine sediment metagenome TaxID=412755 RepID=A0A0F9J4Z5_9ZZZZ